MSCDSSRRVRGIPAGLEADMMNLQVQSIPCREPAGSASDAMRASDREPLGCTIIIRTSPSLLRLELRMRAGCGHVN